MDESGEQQVIPNLVSLEERTQLVAQAVHDLDLERFRLEVMMAVNNLVPEQTLPGQDKSIAERLTELRAGRDRLASSFPGEYTRILEMSKAQS